MGNTVEGGTRSSASPGPGGAAYRAARNRTNTETLQFGAMLALVIDALTYVLYLLTRARDAQGMVELGVFLFVLAASAAFLLRATLDLRENRALSPLAVGGFWVMVVAAGSLGWAVAPGDLRGLGSYAAALLGTALMYRAPGRLALALFLGAAVFKSACVLAETAAAGAAPQVAYAFLYSLIAFAISVRFERDHYRLFQAREELASKNAALEEMSLRDPLTHLFNRRYFMEALSHEIRVARRERRAVALGMVDADHFKRVNDELGHATGDLVLKDLAAVMLEVLRGSDVVARYGGEEFLVILAGCGLERAKLAAERLRRAVEQRSFPGVPWTVTVSIGVTAIQETDTEELLVKRVDDVMYRAKDAGRNRVFAE